MTKSTKYKTALEQVRKLLSKWQSSGVDVFLKLREIDIEGTWKLGAHVSFQDFLKAEFPNVIGIERYNNVISMIEEYGSDFMRSVGPTVPREIMRREIIGSPERKAEVVAAVTAHIRDEGCAPGDQKFRDIARSVAPEIRKPCREVASIRREKNDFIEIVKLRNRTRELEKENKSLKREIVRLNKLLEGIKAA